MLTLRDVDIAVGGRTLLEGVSLTLEPGRAIALFGPSGCGKTTLLRSVACLDDLAEGEMRLGEQRPADVGAPAWRRRVSYVAQRPVLFEGTLRENLERPFAYRSATKAFDEARAEELLGRFDLAEAAEQPSGTLSEGQRQRACLARALLIDPEVLLLDEPTSALDTKRRDAVEGALREAFEDGKSALLVTHELEQAERLDAAVLDLTELCTDGVRGGAGG